MKSDSLPLQILRRTSVMLAVILIAAASAASAQSYKAIHDFTGGNGWDAVGTLVADSAGNFYGVLAQDTGTVSKNCTNTIGCGNVFKLYKTGSGGWASVNIHAFQGGTYDGASPQGGLAIDGSGNLYGTTWKGGVYGQGVAFKMSPPTSGGVWTYSVIYNFGATVAGGYAPQATLTLDAHGNLYGSTILAGNTSGVCSGLGGCGVIFELSPSSSGPWTETVLHTFSGSDGNWPRAQLIFDASGNLYGTTYYGGNLSDCAVNQGCGTVFELSPTSGGSWTLSTLYAFTGGSDGSLPWYAGVIFDGVGNLYGTAAGGGNLTGCNGGCGVVYELSPNGSGGWTQTVIHTFTGFNGTPGYGGAWPVYGLTMDGAGNLFGATYWGGYLGGNANGHGIVFELTPGTGGIWNETVLHAFKGGVNGAWPYQTGLALGSDGNLYGMTIGGGNLSDCNNAGCGVVFRVTP